MQSPACARVFPQPAGASAVASTPGSHTDIGRGQVIASRGIPSQRVPSCVACHGPGASRRNPVYLELVGQYADYLVLQSALFKKAPRGGTAYAHLMRPVAARLTPEQMPDVALYYESPTAARDHSTR